VRTQTSTRQTLAVWPGLVACGCGFAAIQFVWSNFIDGALVDIMGGMGTLLLLALFFRVWKPAEAWRYPGEPSADTVARHTIKQVLHAWSPFILLAILVVLWGLPAIKKPLDSVTIQVPVPGLHLRVVRQPPVVAKTQIEPALFDIAWLSCVGTATLLAGLIAGPILGMPLGATFKLFLRTVSRMRYSIAAICAMLGLGFVTRYSGMDATMGLAMANTGSWFPFFGTMIGWLGVALTGTDAGSNALFGSLQVITANKLNLSPVLMGAANSAGGVMGKMIDAQSIIVGCAATGIEGQEGDLFRAVLKHSIALAVIVGGIVTLYAYVFTQWIPSGHKFW
jgi:lactate permease